MLQTAQQFNDLHPRGQQAIWAQENTGKIRQRELLGNLTDKRLIARGWPLLKDIANEYVHHSNIGKVFGKTMPKGVGRAVRAVQHTVGLNKKAKASCARR
jgi:hypothetical protein